MLDGQPLISNDAVLFGLLATVLGIVFHTSQSPHPFWKKFYSVVPTLLLCYFIPAIFNSLGIIDGDDSELYFVASRYLLPAALILLTLSIDFKAIAKLGPRALIMFFTGTVGILLGGPAALFLVGFFDPESIAGQGGDALWRGMSTVAGSWIGGGANQAAMKEVFEVGDDVFAQMVAVDLIVANLWLAVLLFMAGRAALIDRYTGADNSVIETLKAHIADYEATHTRVTKLPDIMVIGAVAFGGVGLAHAIAGWLAPFLGESAPLLTHLSLSSTFFWIVVIATGVGLACSFTPAKHLDGAGASKIGSAFVYFLVATIGMQMDINAILQVPQLLVIGVIWIAIHAGLLVVVGYLIKAPVFLLAVGSQANVGGAASAPIVASAFHPSLAPVGVLLAVLGYAIGTIAAWGCGHLMRMVAGG